MAHKESLEEQTTESKDSKEKITAMEEVVAMYHEKARAEIEGYAAAAYEDSMIAVFRLWF